MESNTVRELTWEVAVGGLLLEVWEEIPVQSSFLAVGFSDLIGFVVGQNVLVPK